MNDGRHNVFMSYRMFVGSGSHDIKIHQVFNFHSWSKYPNEEYADRTMIMIPRIEA